jgi:hypothetical protein
VKEDEMSAVRRFEGHRSEGPNQWDRRRVAIAGVAAPKRPHREIEGRHLRPVGRVTLADIEAEYRADLAAADVN